MDICVWRLALRQFECRDAERPDVRLAVIARLLYDLGSHPKGSADKRVLLRHGRGELSGDAKVGKLDLPVCTDEDIGR
jgi:hypothetical protein